jgi:hypothetical protein
MSEEKKIIAFAGYAKSGKTTAAEYFQKHNWTRKAFADPLKMMIIIGMGIDSKYVYDPLYKEVLIPGLGLSGRKLMQEIGCMFRDDLPKRCPELFSHGGSFWLWRLLRPDPDGSSIPKHVSNCMNKIINSDNASDTHTDGICIEDARFPDEFKGIKNLGGKIIRIKRDNLTDVRNHISEVEDCSYDDYTITNNGSIDELHKKLSDYIS